MLQTTSPLGSCVYSLGKVRLNCRKQAEGYREKSHYCLSVALLELYVDTGKLPLRVVKDFDRAMLLREEADYRGSFSMTGANDVIANAEQLISMAKTLLGH